MTVKYEAELPELLDNLAIAESGQSAHGPLTAYDQLIVEISPARATASVERFFGCAETALAFSPARATASVERFFGCAETALAFSPALKTRR